MNLKKLIILYFFFSSFLLFSQIPENLNYIQTLDRSINYSSTLLTNGNRLYVDAQGGIEEYLINADGSLELICYISTINQSGVNACIYENYLYVVTQDNDNTNTLIYVINISGDQMYLEQICDTNSTIGMYKIDVNEEYIIHVNNGQVNATVLNRNTLEFVCNLTTGGFFKVDENLLYYQVNNGSSNYLFIDDISNICNQVNISSVYLSENQQNMRYLLEYPYLYIGQNEQVVILDVSDENDPVILSVIEDFENLSFPNFFKSLIRRDNFLIIRNTRNNIWIYDISDLYDPMFENFINEFGLTQCIKDGLISYGDFLYLGQPANNIFQIDAQQLPYLNYINEYGNCGQFIYYGYFYPYLIYSNYYTEEVRFVNILFPDFGSFQLLANANAFVHSYYSNDDVMGFIIADENDNKHLNIYSYDQYNISFESSNSLSHNDFNDVAMIDDYLGIVAEDSGEIQICSINPDYSIEIVHTLYVGEDAAIAPQTNQCTDELFFTCSVYEGERVVQIFEAQYPFNEVGSFSLFQFGTYMRRVIRLSNDRIILFGSSYPDGFYKLAEYNSPEDIVILDIFYTYDGTLKLHDNILIYKRNRSGEIDYISWDNDQFTILGSNEFELETADNFFDYENSKLFTIGRYNIQEYSCDYVSVNDHQIPILSPHLSNYPNPFNPETKIVFNLPKEGDVKLEIYNIKGQKVKTLLDCYMSPGRSEMIWNGEDDNGKRVSSGIYFYQLVTEKKTITKKMILIK